MSTVNISLPQIYMPPGSTGQPNITSYTASSACLDGAIVVLSAGAIAPATANVSGGIAGVALQNSVQNYGVSSQTAPALNAVFGFSQVNTPLVPGDAGLCLVGKLNGPALLEINAAVTVGWVSGGTTQVTVGTAVGIAIDSTTGFYVVDPGQSNAVAVVVSGLQGPSAGGFGTNGPASGTIAPRVLVQFYATALA